MPGEALSTAQIAARILARPGPVVFLDSCAVLDVLRAIHRPDVELTVVASAAKLIQSKTQSDAIWLTTTSNVLQELQQNRDEQIHKLGAKLKEMRAAFARMDSIACCLLPGYAAPLALPGDLADRIASLTDELIAACLPYCGSKDCEGAASARVWQRRHPSPHQGQQYKDCHIFEEFLELTTQLRNGGFSELIVFVTSNKNDYGEPITGPIAAELAVFGARYVTNVAWAYDLVHSRAKSAP